MVAFEEDGWESFEVFSSSTDGVQVPAFGKDAEGKGRGIYTLIRCGRCMVPNIDPATGVRDAYVSVTVDTVALPICKLTCLPPVPKSCPTASLYSRGKWTRVLKNRALGCLAAHGKNVSKFSW